jgi:hypothetical protein
MYFIAYLPVNEIDYEVAQANSKELEWFASKQEIYDEFGEGTPSKLIILTHLEIELTDNHIMTFEDIGMN